MKKIKISIILAAVILNVQTILSQTVTQFPFKEGFDQETFPPTGWSTVNLGTGPSWDRNTVQSTSSPAAAHREMSSEQGDDWLITPPIQLQSGMRYQLSFMSWMDHPFDYRESSIWLSTGSGDPAAGGFTHLKTLTAEEATAGQTKAPTI